LATCAGQTVQPLKSPVKNSEAIDASLLFKLSKYSILQESRGRLSVFLRFGIPDLGGS
jgi:hypothetical protein